MIKRRKFGLVATSGLATAAARPAYAQSSAPDPSLLKSTLTPVGAERAGNADGSIPPWTGGISAPPIGPNDPQNVPMFQDERPLYSVDTDNMAQYSDLLSDGVKALMTRSGLNLKVYQTHRTAAFPQYVIENTAANVTRVVMEPAGGRFGFTGGYGGIPFPIIDTANPLVGGAQLIWNHLLHWTTYSFTTKFTSGWVITNGRIVLVYGGLEREFYPYYDPNGTVDTYDGYYSKLHEWGKAPPSSDGQESLVWTSSNVLVKPNITWAVVNGQGRVRKAPDEAYDTPNPAANGIGNYDDSSYFAGSPQKCDWKVLGKKEMLIPYNGNEMAQSLASDIVKPGFPNPDIIRWEKHRVWVVEASLHPGERNTTARRICYLDEDTYLMMLTEMYDANGTMIKTAMCYNRVLPHLPGTIESGYALWALDTGDYTLNGFMRDPPWDTEQFVGPLSPEFFDPEQMAASASF